MKKQILILFTLFIIGGFLRFYNLNWGSPFYFHPDERNVASAVAQLSFPTQMNPHFFAYGSMPIYAIYFTGLISNFLTTCHLPPATCQLPTVNFDHAIVISRFYSAVFSLLLIPLLYLLGKKLKANKTGLLTSFLSLASVGFIQFAHFGTFEMWLTLLGVLFFWACLSLLKNKRLPVVLLAGIIFGALVSVKVSSLMLFPLPLIAVFLHEKKLLKSAINAILLVLSAAIFYFLTNPYVLLDYPSFLSSIRYESGVVMGTTNVFYTGSFFHTIPVIYQFVRIYPFLLNPLLTILFVPSFFYILFLGIKKRNYHFLLLTSFFLILFLPQAFLFAKWTRYMVPTLPFIYLIIAIGASSFLSERSESKDKTGLRQAQAKTAFIVVILLVSTLFGVSYFITAYVKSDTRTEAAKFAKANIPQAATILSEPYDLGLTALNSNPNIGMFNFYDLDPENSALEEELEAKITQSEYIILPSQRLLTSRLSNPKKFPKGHGFYARLANDALGFQKIYQTPCDIFCKITYLGNPAFAFEETASVFDHPTVLIYKRIK